MSAPNSAHRTITDGDASCEDNQVDEIRSSSCLLSPVGTFILAAAIGSIAFGDARDW